MRNLPTSFLFPIIIFDVKFVDCNITMYQEKGKFYAIEAGKGPY